MHRSGAEIFQPKLCQFTLDICLNLIKPFVVKSSQRLSIIIDQSQIIAHFLRIRVDNLLQIRIFRQAIQHIAHNCYIAQAMMLLSS